MEKNGQFKWSKKGGGVQFYESCTLKGMDYSLYDCVHLDGTCCLETAYIGKLVEMYDTEAHEKMIRTVRSFRPAEIRNYLGDYEPRWNEIFLASGVGKGLSNVNSMEAIVRKCDVVCTSKDVRNPQPSEEELRMANYIFCRTFDVGKCEILENFPDEIEGIEEPEKPMIRIGERGCASNETSILKLVLDGSGTQSARASHGQDKEKHKVRFIDQPPLSGSDARPCKKMSVSDGVASTKGETSRKKPDDDRRFWFKKPPWKEKVQRAQDEGSLVILENLDPSYSSSEVEQGFCYIHVKGLCRTCNICIKYEMPCSEKWETCHWDQKNSKSA